jgi:hypothetical protein
MQSALDSLVATIAGVISGLSPAAKAIVAAVVPLITALVNMALAGSFDTTSIVVLATGALGAVLVYLVPNRAKAAVVPAGK